MSRPRKARHLEGFFLRVSDLIGDYRFMDFEKKCGLKRGTAQNILDGAEPSRDKVEAIVRGTGCNGHWLLTGDGFPFPDTKKTESSTDSAELSEIERLRIRLDVINEEREREREEWNRERRDLNEEIASLRERIAVYSALAEKAEPPMRRPASGSAS